MLRDKHLKYFLYVPILLTCLYNNFWITLLSLDFFFLIFRTYHKQGLVSLFGSLSDKRIFNFLFYLTIALKYKPENKMAGA